MGTLTPGEEQRVVAAHRPPGASTPRGTCSELLFVPSPRGREAPQVRGVVGIGGDEKEDKKWLPGADSAGVTLSPEQWLRGRFRSARVKRVWVSVSRLGRRGSGSEPLSPGLTGPQPQASWTSSARPGCVGDIISGRTMAHMGQRALVRTHGPQVSPACCLLLAVVCAR